MAMCARESRSRLYPRTNALGSAKSDCHTCSRLREKCDRQRPQCGPCLDRGRKCGGFELDIVWKNETQARQRPGLAVYADVFRKDEGAAVGPFSEPIRFINNGAKRRRKTSKRPAAMDRYMTTMSALPDAQGEELTASSDEHGTPFLTQQASPATEDLEILLNEDPDDILPTGPFLASPELNACSPTAGLHRSSPGFFSLVEQPDGDSPEVQGQDFGLEHALQLYDPFAVEEHGIWRNPFPLSPGPLYSSPTNKAAAILDMYDREFCILPLTADCRSNPFRVRKTSCEGSEFLLHAMLAISSQHLAKKNNSVMLAAEMRNHQATALRLFAQALSDTPAFQLLDALLLLVNFEATQTASSTWTVHIRGAQKLLESMGGVTVCQWGPRVRAQVAMLVWWDVTLAMISRTRPLLPLSYLETLMEYDDEDEWTFFELNGCPAELVMAMARLATLAVTYETVHGMEWVTFDTFPVEQITQNVQHWTNDKDATADHLARADDDCNEDPDTQRNAFHCTEAWRHAILLYAYRVFHRPQTSTGMRAITHLSRVVLDHVRCIPETAIVQKQTLLPVFLAAAEVGDEPTRDFVRRYCAHWSTTARYSMFGTVATLLERIWANWTTSTREHYWWGAKVGSPGQNRGSPGGSEGGSEDEEGLVSELLLG